jgi:hypothetical protein
VAIRVEVSVGEFRDKLSILEIKNEKITDPSKLANVRRELEVLRGTWAASPLATADIRDDYAELMTLNRALWDIEDRIRDREVEGRFDREFVELARSVYRTNDRRAAVKKRINLRLGSELVEEKSYRGPQSSAGGAS